jgi:hypothetical protein
MALAAIPPGARLAVQSKWVDDAALRNASGNGDEWLTYGRDHAGTH